MLDQNDLKMIARVVSEVVEPIKQDVSGLKADVSVLKEDVSGLKQDVSQLKSDMAEQKQAISQLQDDMAEQKQAISQLRDDMAEQKQAISQLQDDMAEQKQAVVKLQTDVSEIHLILENDVRKRIDIIAEGHLNLNRKLDDALRVEGEKEMTILRVTKLENEVRGLKARSGVRV